MLDNAISVTQLNEYLRTLVNSDDFLASIVVRGEISNLTYHRSGHIYFTLKDETSIIKAVMFRTQADRLKFQLKEGMKVLVFGRIDVYTQGGQYQLYANTIQADGIGDLYQQYEQIKEKLQKEGLFDEKRKKALPIFPKTIGIITSPTGAVIHDLCRNIKRRYKNVNILLYPSLVQGEEAVPNLISGMEYFNAMQNVDVIIIGRGGGSIEDLWAFNSIDLAYTIAKSKIPVISAVGHESDFTICDFVADVRASTPTGAAELAVPDSNDIKLRFVEIYKRINNSLYSKIDFYKQHISNLSKRRVLVSKEALLDDMKMNVARISDSLDNSIDKKIKKSQNDFSIISAKLNTLSPLNTLKRGYTMAENEDGTVIDSVEKIKEKEILKIVFSDGYSSVSVNNTVKNKFGE